MRTKKELIQLLIARIEKIGYLSNGLCFQVDMMRYIPGDEKITREEADILFALIKTAKPYIWETRYWCHNGVWSRKNGYQFFWEPGLVLPRLEWLNKQLAKL
jgi:hypothetical protein